MIGQLFDWLRVGIDTVLVYLGSLDWLTEAHRGRVYNAQPSMPPSRMVTSSRRAGRVTNKTKLLIYRGSDKIDDTAETIHWDHDSSSNAEPSKSQHVGAKGVDSGEALVS